MSGMEEIVPAVRAEPVHVECVESSVEKITNKPNTNSSKYQSTNALPTWVTNDRQVLRFFCYYEEPAYQAPLTLKAPKLPSLIRRLVLLYYLADASIEVMEPRVRNSGLPQGLFMKKSILKKKDGQIYIPSDFIIGKSIVIKGQKCTIVDCDTATKEYYTEMNLPIGYAQPYPDEPTTSAYRQTIQAMKEMKSLKKTPVKENAAKVHQFMQYSTQVLRFFCSWDDPHPLYPETRHFVLHYFLADDTVEVREAKKDRERRGNSFAVLLSRRKLPYEGEDKSPRNVTPLDLRCGDDIVVFGRLFHLESCDEFTKQYYLLNHGITQEPEEKHNEKPKHDTQPSNQDAVEDTFLGPLMAKSEVKPKLKSHEHHTTKYCLRFRAQFSPKLQLPAEQAARNFIITFYLVDLTMAIYEPPVPNSGVQGGKFLDRGNYKNINQEFFRPRDFYVGATIALALTPNQPFLLQEADVATLAYCEANPEIFIYSDINHILSKVVHIVRANGSNIRTVFENEGNGNRYLPPAEMLRILSDRLHIDTLLSRQEWITLCRAYVYTAEDQSSIDSFCDAVSRAYISDIDPKKSMTIHEQLQRIPVDLRQAIARHDNEGVGKVSNNLIVKLVNFYHLDIPENILVRYMTPDGYVDYHRFFDDVYTCDFANEDNQEEIPKLPTEGGRPMPPPLDERGPLYIPTYRSQLDTARFGILGPPPLPPPNQQNNEDQASSLSVPASSPVTSASSSTSSVSHKTNKNSSLEAQHSESNQSASSCTTPMSKMSFKEASAMVLNPRFRTTSQLMHDQIALAKQVQSTLSTPKSVVSTSPSEDPKLTKEQRSALYRTTTQEAFSGLAKARDMAGQTARRSSALVERAKAKFLQGQAGSIVTDISKLDPTIHGIFAEKFDQAKYLLRKTLRDADRDKSGFLGEDDFMQSLNNVNSNLSDEEQYQLVAALFPTHNATINYKMLLDTVFQGDS
ncbi:hypothetical protein THRCLA_11298 [Thraustotheca clavata]|uniref:Uncharacterized protein n=1 Tax=Thraustotheca clavata TaxID=74557 RepID=A0A1V9Y850_9STRA|nr:hypothetical protein THRCLA_11298 [Thraustotheca clavata]